MHNNKNDITMPTDTEYYGDDIVVVVGYVASCIPIDNAALLTESYLKVGG